MKEEDEAYDIGCKKNNGILWKIWKRLNICSSSLLMHMQLKTEKRCLEIPEGVKSISEDAAAVYNIGSIVSNISYILDHQELQRIEWEKKLRQRRLIKMTFPKEAGATASERSAYLVGKELRVRLVKMHLPASLESVSAAAFPKFLEAIEVDEGNAQYASVDGVLFSKDLKKLIRYPGYTGDQYSIPEGTECIAQEAFFRLLSEKTDIAGIDKDN